MINSRIEKEALVEKVVRRTGNCALTVEKIRLTRAGSLVPLAVRAATRPSSSQMTQGSANERP